MLVATIEIWPFGREEDKRDISRLFIANTLETNDVGEYKYKCRLIRNGDVPIHFTDDDAWFWHQRDNGADVCVSLALQALEHTGDIL